MRKATLMVPLALLSCFIVLSAGCGRQNAKQTQALSLGGDVERGREALLRNGCGNCHAIPGVMEAETLSGPSLAGFGKRWYIAGILPNTPANMVLWIRDPQRIQPDTGKSAAALPEDEIRDMAAYLYSSP